MLLRERSHDRGVEDGPYPLEALAHDERLIALEADSSAAPHSERGASSHTLAEVARHYQQITVDAVRPADAPPGACLSDPQARSREIKGAAYYLDASHVGICVIPDAAWRHTPDAHCRYAIVLWVQYGRDVADVPLAAEWTSNAQFDLAALRAAEIGACLTGHIRALGFRARLHTQHTSTLDHDKLAVLAGIGQRTDHQVVSPFFGAQYASSVIITDYAMATDQPLASQATVNRLRYWWGINGARSGREQRRMARRRGCDSRYPMEQVRRVSEPTTLIMADDIPRVPKRAEFFARARAGDLGDKARREVARFAFKHPLTDGMMGPLRAMVPYQDGHVAPIPNGAMQDAQTNTDAIKALSYHLGADLTGICEIPDYAWYSHGPDGHAIQPRHRYAVVMLIDQGFDTMEGASGDDWISGCQSMRGYLRGAQIAGVMGEFLRRNGFAARAQTNADSEVLHIPLLLLAGLGELSRIGELVLNPFVGPRFKSVVLTTNLPLIPDQPIDFGLQQFCAHCRKCARECPVNAIPFGDKVMFNGYEIWKPDVERCARYRITNPKGSACGRCMKTCPLNKVVDADGGLLTRLASWMGIHTPWLKALLIPAATWLDDRLGFGQRNPRKRWWSDLEIVDGRVGQPAAGTNERDLSDRKATVRQSPIAYYPASTNPPADAAGAVPVDRKAALKAAQNTESVSAAAARRRRTGSRKPDG